MSHSELMTLKKTKMRSYYETVVLEMTANKDLDQNQSLKKSSKCGGDCKSFSFLVFATLYLANFSLICLGFLKHAILITITGMYGVYQTTCEFAKVYPNWFERKLILLTFFIVLGSNCCINFQSEAMLLKMYPTTKHSYYFYVLIHYVMKSIALIMLFFVANIDQHVPALQSLTNKNSDSKDPDSEPSNEPAPTNSQPVG
mmetsp:Transcript_27277/g.26321  ORF Transcript_27277/g.26321 Transcript_27277/m.26321 type:complete len:200 (-) Transcript_27277:991-1590(-)|eukprot:CAMPEP_0170554034 /NCGR_PEP_ID=MMETSP0211-20121228/11894_1 /TAXON_ID=311385 /ORGANISM="Pseudokeronopsis sp., Strain OXSARD2" /LENGTH=199 /DNA_ID=CAMNT_0010862815 /DNA_START=510 /DNA_END=1109 /DNA_ORIENTATION=+